MEKLQGKVRQQFVRKDRIFKCKGLLREMADFEEERDHFHAGEQSPVFPF
jgi:hypothetical protein